MMLKIFFKVESEKLYGKYDANLYNSSISKI